MNLVKNEKKKKKLSADAENLDQLDQKILLQFSDIKQSIFEKKTLNSFIFQ